MLKNELSSGRPIVYSGYGPDGSGHAFVLDGYTDDGYFGVNWGWGGLADGYFLIDAMEPSEAGAGGGAGSFSLNQIAVLGLKPDEGGNYVESLGFMKYSDAAGDFNGLSIRYGTIAQEQYFSMNYGLIYNRGAVDFNGEICFALADRTGNIREVLESWAATIAGTGLRGDKSLYVSSPVVPGDRVRAYFRTQNTPEWTVITGNEDNGCVWELVVPGDEPPAYDGTVEEETSVRYSKTGGILRVGLPEDVSYVLKDAGGTDITSSCVVTGDVLEIDTAGLEAGTYTLVLSRQDDVKEISLIFPQRLS